MQRSALALVFLLAATGSMAGPQQQQPAASNKPAAKQQQGTQQNPLFVKVIPAENTAPEQTQENEKERAAKLINDNKITQATEKIRDFTLALVIVGIVQAAIFFGQLGVFWWQGTKLQKTIESNERIERAYIFVDGYLIHRTEKIGVPNAWTIRIKFKNVGRTPARLTGLRVHFIDKNDLPEKSDYTLGNDWDYVNTLAANKAFKTREVGPAITVKDGKPIEYIVYGLITYRDLAGKECHTGFGISVSPIMPVGSSLINEAYDWYD